MAGDLLIAFASIDWYQYSAARLKVLSPASCCRSLSSGRLAPGLVPCLSKLRHSAARSRASCKERSVGRLGRFDLRGGQWHRCTPPVLELEYVQKMYPKEAGLQEMGVEPQRPKSPQLAGSMSVA